MPRGGVRPGSGRKKGYKEPHTIEKEDLRKLYRELAAPHLREVLEAQLDTARGVQHMMAKDSKTGQWIQVTDPQVMLACLNSGESFYKIVAQNPNVQAQKDIFDRLMDQPARQIEVAGPEGGPLEIVLSLPWRK